MAKPSDRAPTQGFSRRTFLKSLGLSAAATGLVGAAGEGARAAQPTILGPDPVPLSLTVNGRVQTITVEPRVTLLRALRNHLGLTGAKEICERGACGGCTVLLDLRLPPARRGRRRPRDHYGRRAGRAGPAQPGAGRLRGMRRSAMRILHTGVRGSLHRAAPAKPASQPGGDQSRAGGQSLPVRDVRPDLRGRPESGPAERVTDGTGG